MALLTASAPLSSLAGAALTGWTTQQAARQWGIFATPRAVTSSQAGSAATWVDEAGSKVTSLFASGPKPVLSAAHVASVTFREQSHVSSAPQESGAFASYDKIFDPYTASIEFLCDGSETGSLAENLLSGLLREAIGTGPAQIRKDFVATLALLVKDTQLYRVATPERIYKNATIIGYSFSRQSRNGAEMIIASVQVQEIRQSRQSGWVSTRYPQGASRYGRGPVTPLPRS